MNVDNHFPVGSDDESVFPISFAQQRLWFLHQLDPQSAAYNMALPMRFRGDLNATALGNALAEILRRHEPLRTIFKLIDGEPMQVIVDSAAMQMPILDLSCLSETEREKRAAQLIRQDANEPFDLSRDLMMRAQLLRLDSSNHILALTLHHISADGWSIEVLFSELATLYKDFCESRPPSLPDLPIQYADFAVWQRQWLQGDILGEHLQYWKTQLAGAPELLEFPSDRPHASTESYSHGAQSLVTFDQNLTNGLRSLSQREGCSLYMTLLTAFQILAMRYTGEDDIVLGSPLGIRNSETENLIGCFINTVVIRTDLSGDPTFHELLGRVQGIVVDALDHGDMPLDLLVEELNVPRHAGRNPLFQTLFQVLSASAREIEFSGLTVERLWPIENDTAKFDLTFTLEERSDGMMGHLEYNADLFDRTTIERLLSHYQILLNAIVANPHQKIGTLPLLSRAEKQQILVEWNDTAVSYPKNLSLPELFEKQVELTPDSIAVIFDEQQLSYRELNQRANQLARHLIKLGIGTDTLVGICLERSVEMVVAIFGILKAGGAYVPLDPEYPEERLRFMVQDAQTPVVLTQKSLEEKIFFGRSKTICLDSKWEFQDDKVGRDTPCAPLSSIVARASRPCDPIETHGRDARATTASVSGAPGATFPTIHPENLAYVIYTSGSTGQPKGVMISHGAICNHMLWMQERFPLNNTDRVLQKTPFSFDASVWEFFAPLLAGAQLVIAKPGGHRDSAYLAKTIAEQNITILQVVPSVLRVLLDEPEFRNNSLKRLFCGGEALPPDLAKQFASISKATLCNLYGPTEATIDATFHVACGESSSIPIGKPIANTQTYILDKHLQPAPIGVPGELCIGGSGVARGYWKRPELTAEKFIPDPFSKGKDARLYKTGDLARYLPDGRIEYLGRMDHQVKLRGFRIELEEIESVLRNFPGIRQTVVMARDDSGETRLVAYLVWSDTMKPEDELRAYLNTKLPDYMAPAAFVWLDALPLMPNGKVDRKALPVPDFAPDTSRFIAPRTPLEMQLAQIWCDVLKLQQIGINDNFFELGGHSLLATQVVSRMRPVSRGDISLRHFFSTPTVAGLSALIEDRNQKETVSPTIARLPRKITALVP